MKIVSSGKAIHSPGFFEKKKRNRRIKLVAWIVAFILFISFVVYLFHIERFLIKGVKVSGDSVTDNESIVTITQDLIKGSYFFVLPRSNILVYPENEIEESILKEFPRLKSVTMSLEGLNLLILEITERLPKAIYCSNTCFLVDEDGFIFAEAPSFTDGVYLIFETSIPIENPVGKTLMSKEDFTSLLNFTERLTDLGVYASKLRVRNEEYALVLPNGGEIIWKKDADLNIIFSNLEAFLTNPVIKNQKNFIDKISKIDLRTESKVFYKFRDQKSF